ncbi:CLUMA_CG007217, isoform A [Clunio marinus]|uniref:CLUMA_CG007217, isoform A n=1 Tax=Clunio marinus TaxID=568069 RepID=A0A1J1I016_9DIPT|nr:CLUMA_CG007217, isoform A [Clunio marinus]
MYPLSKNKSSFRIADILHQQQQNQHQTDSQLLAHHLMLKNNIQSGDLTKNMKAHSNEMKNTNDLSIASKSPSPDKSPIPEISPEHAINKGDIPMKPTPLYTNFPLPFPLGIHPAFHPAAAYLNYADAIHKVSSSRMWPFYHPYSSYLMPPCGSKRKGGQVRFTPQQTQNLERRFSNHKYLSPEDRRKLAMELSLSDRQVKTWFQNRRAKWRRANNATGSSNGQPNQSSNGDNASSGASSDDDDISQRPLQMYLHHQQYYKQMKELQKQQKETSTTSDNNSDNDVDVN